MYHKILLAILFLIVIYLLYQNYNIQREIYKIKNSFEELNNFLDLSIKKSKPKVLDTLSSINTNDITDNIVTYSNDVKRMQPEATINSDEQNNEQNNEENNEQSQNVQIVHLQDTSDSQLGSYNLRVFNNISASLPTQLDTTSSSHQSNDLPTNNLVILSPKDSDSELNESPKQSPKQSPKESPKQSPKQSPKESTKESPKQSPKLKSLSESISSASESKNSASESKNSASESKNSVSESKNSLPKTVEPSIKSLHTLDELNKLTIVNIKEIAKKLNIVLSVTGKLKNKATLISDILRHSS